jgi:flagellar protein FliL
LTGNKSIDTILTALLLAASAGTVGIFVYTEMLYERPLPSEIAERKELIEASKKRVFPDIYKMDKMVINLLGRNKRLRYLDLQVHLVPFKSEQVEKFESSKSFIHDAIIDLVSHMEPEELNSVAGKILLEERIKRRLNDNYRKPTVKQIFFSNFVIQ